MKDGIVIMIKKLYHGSVNIIEKPEFGLGKSYNDYGSGFYCTEIQDMAKEWGVSRNKSGYANSYELECDGLNILNLNDNNYNILHWLSILIQNREFDSPSVLANEAKDYLKKEFYIDINMYDAITGYRADDSYFSFAQDFLNGTISVRQLNNAMHLGKMGQQFVLKSKKAFDLINFTGYEIADCREWYEKKHQRDLMARREYFNREKMRRQKGDIYIIQILDEEMRQDDTRLR